MDTRIQKILEDEMKERNYPDFEAGDTIRVRTREDIGGQMRPRSFEGVCIGREGKGPNRTFKVRKTSFGVGIERIFPLYSPIIQEIEIVRKGKVRRSKLTYLEGRSQKDSRIKQQRVDLDEVNRVEDMESEPPESSDETQKTDESDDAANDLEAEDGEDNSEEQPSEDRIEEPDESEADSDGPSPEETAEEPVSQAQQITQEEKKKEEVGESV